MKKIVLMLLILVFVVTTNAQDKVYKSVSAKLPAIESQIEAPVNSGTVFNDDYTPQVIHQDVNGRALTFVELGRSGNAYGFYNNSRTYLWADPAINSVVFTHRMTGGTELEGNSRVAYDVSTDGGATWVNNTKVYQPFAGGGGEYVEAAGRYPQGAILNPAGNTDPENAFYTYFITTIINTNGIWGGTAYGSNPLTQTDTPNPSQANLDSEDGYYWYVPEAYTTTQDGKAFIADASLLTNGTDWDYVGEYIIGKGEMTDTDTIAFEIVTVPFLFDFTGTDFGINDTKIAFGPDGQTGYIVVMTEPTEDEELVPYTNYHPVLMKTTDGGESWSDPIHIQLGGEDGIESLKNYFHDTIIESVGDPQVYPPGFDRNEVYYNMGFQVDLIVDKFNNPHVTGIIAIGSVDGWYPYYKTMATWHLYSTDGGMTFDGTALYEPYFMEAAIGDIVQYNRPYASSTYDGHYLFFSWLDNTIDDATELSDPDIFVVGYDVEDMTYSSVENVTSLTQAWFKAYYGSQSQYVFSEMNGDMYDCEIPFVYTEFTVPGDDTQEMKFWYIDGYTMSMPVGIPDGQATPSFTVAQNSPNPAVTKTDILVNVETAGTVQLTVSNMLGQVLHQEAANVNALAHTFYLNVANYETGVYFYTIQMGNEAVTKKMIVK